MAINLKNIVPFGRCLDEYRGMFNLTAEELDRKIIGVGDGPASFQVSRYLVIDFGTSSAPSEAGSK